MQCPKRNLLRSLACATIAAAATVGLFYFIGSVKGWHLLVALLMALVVGRETLYWSAGGSIPQGPREPLPKDPPPPEPEKQPLPPRTD